MISFYNFATGTLLDELSTLIKSSNGSSTWRPLITYKNILRAIENIGTEMSLGLRLLSNFFYSFSNLLWQRFIGRGTLSGKNYVRLVEQHKLSKEYMMQAETFASNLRENLDKVRQTEAFKTYNSTFQLLSRATNVTFETRSKCSQYPYFPFPPHRSELLDSLFNYFTETVNVMNQMRGIITEIQAEIQVLKTFNVIGTHA